MTFVLLPVWHRSVSSQVIYNPTRSCLNFYPMFLRLSQAMKLMFLCVILVNYTLQMFVALSIVLPVLRKHFGSQYATHIDWVTRGLLIILTCEERVMLWWEHFWKAFLEVLHGTLWCNNACSVTSHSHIIRSHCLLLHGVWSIGYIHVYYLLPSHVTHICRIWIGQMSSHVAPSTSRLKAHVSGMIGREEE